MADFDHSDFGGAYDAPVRSTFSTVLNWVGAALSLALIAGLGYWAYQLVVRDVTGVPVVRALEGPMRIAPTETSSPAERLLEEALPDWMFEASRPGLGAE